MGLGKAIAKVFGGKRYQFYGTYHRKSEAQRMAKRFRDGGEPARVGKDVGSGQWAVYVRYEKGRG